MSKLNGVNGSDPNAVYGLLDVAPAAPSPITTNGKSCVAPRLSSLNVSPMMKSFVNVPHTELHSPTPDLMFSRME